MNQTREEYLMKHAEHAQRLDDLAGELQTLDLSEISHKVGGLRSSIKHANINLSYIYFLFGRSRCCHAPLKHCFLVLVSPGLRQSVIGSGLVLVLSLWRSGLHGL